MTADEARVESSPIFFSQIAKSTLGSPRGTACSTGQAVRLVGHPRFPFVLFYTAVYLQVMQNSEIRGYPLGPGFENILMIPDGSQLLPELVVEDEAVFLKVRLTSNLDVARFFRLVNTGDTQRMNPKEFIATGSHSNGIVWHLLEVLPGPTSPLVVWKYTLRKMEDVIEVPKGALISPFFQHDALTTHFWALVDPNRDVEKRRFRVSHKTILHWECVATSRDEKWLMDTSDDPSRPLT